MADVTLPSADIGGKTLDEKYQNLYNSYCMLRKELEFILSNLDQGNMGKEFDGYIKKLAADVVDAGTVISNTIITQNLYAQLGTIARLTVDRLLSGNVLNGDDVMRYIEIKDQCLTFIKAVKNTSVPQIQYTNEKNELLYYKLNETSGTQEITTEVTDTPVMVYQYIKYEKFKIYYEINDTLGIDSPKIVWGSGNGTGDEQKAFMYKDDTGMLVKYIQSGGNELSIKLGEEGILVNGSSYHKITTGTGFPVGGNDGDIYFKVV
jgi:hypothetical protein